MEPHVLNPEARGKGDQMLTIHLTAESDGDDVVILGSKARIGLPKGSGEHTFKFQLTDNTKPKRNVRFSAFGAERDVGCPSAPGGDAGGQVIGVDFKDSKAEFTDLNSEMCTFGYTWFFAYDNSTKQPTFDPIIDNGGR